MTCAELANADTARYTCAQFIGIIDKVPAKTGHFATETRLAPLPLDLSSLPNNLNLAQDNSGYIYSIGGGTSGRTFAGRGRADPVGQRTRAWKFRRIAGRDQTNDNDTVSAFFALCIFCSLHFLLHFLLALSLQMM